MEALVVSGAIHLRSSRVTHTIDLRSFLQGGRTPATSGVQLFSIRTPPFSNMSFDISVDSREPLLIRSNIARASVRTALELKVAIKD